VRVSGLDVTDDPIERGLEALVGERLQQIVGGVRLEGAERVLVVRGDEDDRGRSNRVELGGVPARTDWRTCSIASAPDALQPASSTLASRASSRRTRSRPGFSSSTTRARIRVMGGSGGGYAG
jgi:hypothetical protein